MASLTFGPVVTLRRARIARGFFRLSSVGEKLRTEAWLRLIASRSGGGKAGKQQLHSDNLFPGRCHAHSDFRTVRKGKKGPQLAVGLLGSRTKDHPHLFRDSLPGNLPTGVVAFPGAIFCGTRLPKAVDWLPVPSLCEIAGTVANTVVFLPLALRQRTRTRFSCSRYYQPLLFGGTQSGNATGKG
jgi:hypothetical protein